MPSRRDFITVAALAAGGLVAALIGDAFAADEKPMLMFVQTAERVAIDKTAQTIQLVNVGQQTLYFADRPVRLAGHIKMDDYLKEWTSKAGKDNFGKDPPNAALSVFEPGQTNNTLAVITISEPRIEGADLIYGYKTISGTLPTAAGQTSLFIDWIGVGGGVGVGFHGAGVGFRGPGWR